MNESPDRNLMPLTTMPTPLGDSQHSPVARTARWRSWLLLCVIFAAGITIGAAGTMKFIHYRIRTLLLHPDQVPDQVVEVLRHRLSLTEPQTRQVANIIRRRHAALEQLRAEVSPQVAVELTQLRTEVAALLTADQLPRWQSFCTRLDPLGVTPQTQTGGTP